MADIHHFVYGPITPILSYALSVLGSLLALTCAVRAREARGNASRAGWIALAAIALGGTGIWTMHFMAMLGFAVEGMVIRYDVPVTAFSAGIAILSTAIGLSIVGFGRFAIPRVLIGGLFTGLGVAAMHYTGMAAMRLDGTIGYDRPRVIGSVVIAVVAATVALWLAVTVRRTVAIVGSALLMGLAVNGMHFTGMSAMSVWLGDDGVTVAGATAGTLLVPIVLAVIVGVIGLIYAVLAAPTDEDRAGARYLQQRLAERGEPGLGDAGASAGAGLGPVASTRSRAVTADGNGGAGLGAVGRRPPRTPTPGGSGFNGFDA